MLKIVIPIIIALLLFITFGYLYLVMGVDIPFKTKVLATDLLYINNPQKSSIACRNAGGQWWSGGGPWWRPEEVGGKCVFPPRDEGKACYQNSECEIQCIQKGKDSEGYFIGECGRYSVTVCSPAIPYKTKDYQVLDGGSCV